MIDDDLLMLCHYGKRTIVSAYIINIIASHYNGYRYVGDDNTNYILCVTTSRYN